MGCFLRSGKYVPTEGSAMTEGGTIPGPEGTGREECGKDVHLRGSPAFWFWEKSSSHPAVYDQTGKAPEEWPP